MSEQEQHSEIRDLLRNLESIKASDDFENRLHKKLIEEERRRRHEHSEKYSSGIIDFVQRLLTGKSHPWLVPATGFVALMFAVLYFVYSSRNIDDNEKLSRGPEISATVTDSVADGKDIAGTTEDLSTDNEGTKSPSENKPTDIPKGDSETSTDLNVPDKRGPPSYGIIEKSPAPADANETEEPGKSEGPVTTEAPETNPEPEDRMKSDEVTAKDAAEEEMKTGLMKGRESAMMPDAGVMEQQEKDTVKSARKKLEMLNKKWLEELEKKINE